MGTTCLEREILSEVQYKVYIQYQPDVKAKLDIAHFQHNQFSSWSIPNSIMNLLTFSAKPRLKSLLFIILITSKLIQKKMLNLRLVLYTLSWYLNKWLSRNSLRKTSTQVSFNLLPLCIVYQSYLSKRKMAYYTSASTSVVLTIFPKRITIHFHSSLICQTHFAKLEYIQRQIFTILTTWFALPTVMNERPL